MLGEDIGMRLKAMEYWKCAEVGLTVPSTTHGEFLLKLVIGEPLLGFGKYFVYPTISDDICEEVTEKQNASRKTSSLKKLTGEFMK